MFVAGTISNQEANILLSFYVNLQRWLPYCPSTSCHGVLLRHVAVPFCVMSQCPSASCRGDGDPDVSLCHVAVMVALVAPLLSVAVVVILLSPFVMSQYSPTSCRSVSLRHVVESPSVMSQCPPPTSRKIPLRDLAVSTSVMSQCPPSTSRSVPLRHLAVSPSDIP